jgi:hypothetical protein
VKSDFIELSDGDEPVPNPEHDKFHLANRILNEDMNLAIEEGSDGNEPLGRIEEQLERDFVRVKYESY